MTCKPCAKYHFQQRGDQQDPFSEEIPDQALMIFAHDVMFFGERLYEGTNIVTGNLSVLENWSHLAEMGFEFVGRVNVAVSVDFGSRG